MNPNHNNRIGKTANAVFQRKYHAEILPMKIQSNPLIDMLIEIVGNLANTYRLFQ